MRKLKLLVQTSIDGFIADKNGKTDWMLWNWGNEWNWDDELRKYFTDLTNSIDCILLSRQMAEEGFVAHWANMAANHDNPQSSFAKKITGTHKIVFSTTLKKSIWNNTSLAAGNYVDEINQLKKQNGKDIIVYGGATFVSSLIKTELIDECHLFINPTVLGNGLTIFRDIEKKQNLKFKKVTGFDCGVVVQVYELMK